MEAFYDVSASVLMVSWVLWIVASFLLHLLLPWSSRLPSLLYEMLTYGKLKSFGAGRASVIPAKTPSQIKRPPSFMACLNSVPRRYFTHFYVWGSIWNTVLIITFTYKTLCTLSWFDQRNNGGLQKTKPLLQSEFDVFLTLILLLCQTLRRLFECLFVTRHSERKMHVVHYVLGLYFYTAVGPTAILSLNQESEGHKLTNGWFLLQWRHLAAVMVFVWAGYHQYTCHVILANIRSSRNNCSSERSKVDDHPPDTARTLRVGIPQGDWFCLVSCPHYLAEIIIYCSLLLVQWSSLTMVAPCLFVILVLGLSARQMHSWYHNKFDDYPNNRKRIIPYIF